MSQGNTSKGSWMDTILKVVALVVLLLLGWSIISDGGLSGLTGGLEAAANEAGINVNQAPRDRSPNLAEGATGAFADPDINLNVTLESITNFSNEISRAIEESVNTVTEETRNRSPGPYNNVKEFDFGAFDRGMYSSEETGDWNPASSGQKTTPPTGQRQGNCGENMSCPEESGESGGGIPSDMIEGFKNAFGFGD